MRFSRSFFRSRFLFRSDPHQASWITPDENRRAFDLANNARITARITARIIELAAASDENASAWSRPSPCGIHLRRLHPGGFPPFGVSDHRGAARQSW